MVPIRRREDERCTSVPWRERSSAACERRRLREQAPYLAARGRADGPPSAAVRTRDVRVFHGENEAQRPANDGACGSERPTHDGALRTTRPTTQRIIAIAHFPNSR